MKMKDNPLLTSSPSPSLHKVTDGTVFDYKIKATAVSEMQLYMSTAS